jgi:hypothetical protein
MRFSYVGDFCRLGYLLVGVLANGRAILRCIICRGNFMSAAIFGVDGGVFLIVRARATTATVAAFSAFLPRIALSLKTLSRY